jgi:hypothetical protein
MPGSEPKGQHYVHRAYLEGFVDPQTVRSGEGYLWVYIPSKSPFRQRPERVAKRNYYYCYERDDQRQFNVEHGLQQMEDAALPILRRLRDSDFGLTGDERMTFAGYVALSAVRVPIANRQIDRITSLVHAKQIEFIANNDAAMSHLLEEHQKQTGEKIDAAKFKADLIGGSTSITQESRGFTLLQMFQLMQNLHELIYKMQWTFLIAPDDDSAFLTSDNPVSTHDPMAAVGNIGFASSPAAHFTFPLSRKVCLLGGHRPASKVEQLSGFVVRSVNKGTIIRSDTQVYAPSKSNKIQMIVDDIARQKPKSQRVLLKHGRVIEE